MVLNSDRYIHDKIFGDGFGYLRADFERSIAIASGQEKLSGTEAQQEVFMINGDFHSGPIGAIRFVGVVGFALLFPLFYQTIKMALFVIKYSGGTEFQFVSYFYGLQVILAPFIFLFVFGDYRVDICAMLFYVGMLKMIHNSIGENFIIIKK